MSFWTSAYAPFFTKFSMRSPLKKKKRLTPTGRMLRMVS